MSDNFIKTLRDRELLHQMTDPNLEKQMQQESFAAYIGFDPTAASLHVGSLLQILALVRLQKAGHRPIAIVGGGTGLIGDPSGKSSERSMLTHDQLDVNIRGIRSQLERFLDFSGSSGAILVNNADWLCNINLIDFLRDVGKYFSVNQMMTRDSVRLRLENREQGISYTEFSYSLLQAFDFLELYDKYGCRLQIGGSDQWGNIVDGTDLIRRLRGDQAFGVTQPLVSRADGQKFGKTESGNVWLDPELTHPFEFHQFWVNVDDREAIQYLKYFTFLTLDEIDGLGRESVASPERRIAQRRLADEVTAMVHGDTLLAMIKRAASALFDVEGVSGLSRDELEVAFSSIPRLTISAQELGTEELTLAALVTATGLASSRSNARQAIESGGISLNQEIVQDPHRVLTRADLLAGRYALLRRGKKTHYVIDVSGTD